MSMEIKNPLEEIRNAILESQLFGVENEITQLGVSKELLKISDALDNYYGIKRKDEPDTRLAGRSRLPREGGTWGPSEGGAAEVEGMERLP